MWQIIIIIPRLWSRKYRKAAIRKEELNSQLPISVKSLVQYLKNLGKLCRPVMYCNEIECYNIILYLFLQIIIFFIIPSNYSCLRWQDFLGESAIFIDLGFLRSISARVRDLFRHLSPGFGHGQFHGFESVSCPVAEQLQLRWAQVQEGGKSNHPLYTFGI